MIYALTALLLLSASLSYSQTTCLEKMASEVGLEVSLPESAVPSDNQDPVYPYALNEKNTPTQAMIDKEKRVPGELFFNSFFGCMTSILRCHNKTYGDYVVMVYVSSAKGWDSERKGRTPSRRNIDFYRINRDFNHGDLNGPTAGEVDDLLEMIQEYPLKTARRFFNASAMLTYPVKLQHNSFEGKYCVGNAVVAGRKGREVYLYFLMTENNYKHFDTFLKDFKGAFRFK